MARVSHSQLRVIGVLLVTVALFMEPTRSAHADSSSAQACAGKLSPEAQAIYGRAAPRVTPMTDLPSLLKATVPGLVFEGAVRAATARASAISAARCLRALK
jgi:hypothetical protein